MCSEHQRNVRAAVDPLIELPILSGGAKKYSHVWVLFLCLDEVEIIE